MKQAEALISGSMLRIFKYFIFSKIKSMTYTCKYKNSLNSMFMHFKLPTIKINLNFQK